MTGADELDIDEETLAPAPQGAPADFRERLVLALKTTDATTLAAAERDFRGCYDSPDEYVREALARHLPDWLAWVLDSCDVRRRGAREVGRHHPACRVDCVG